MGGKKSNKSTNSTPIQDVNRELFNLTREMHDMLAKREASLRKREGRLERRIKRIAELKKEDENLPEQLSGTRANRSFQTNISFQDVSGAKPEFSGSDDYDIKHWVEDVESVSTLLNWTPLENFLYARRLLSGTVKLALRAQHKLSSWEELKAFLLDEFSERVSSADAHGRLASRKQQKSEFVYDYFLSMRELGAKGHVEEGSVIQYVIDGINDTKQNKIILYGATNYRDFKIKLDTYRSFTEASSYWRHSSADTRRDNHSKEKCFNCGLKGHVVKYASHAFRAHVPKLEIVN